MFKSIYAYVYVSRHDIVTNGRVIVDEKEKKKGWQPPRATAQYYTSRLQYFSQWPYLGRLFICREVSNQMGPSPTIGSQGRQQLRR